jgi:uncharacterized protein (TIGR03435 family)
MFLRILFATSIWFVIFVPDPLFHSNGPDQTFEVASIKSSAPGAGGGGPNSMSGDQATYRNTTLKNVLVRAFELKFGIQVIGPSWISTERFDIVAKAPDHTPADQIPAMLRALLIERFNLELHHETRELPAYALILGKGRFKLKEQENPQAKDTFDTSNGHREAKNMSMSGLTKYLMPMVQAPILEMTGLTGHYNFPLEFSSEEAGGAPDKPSIFTILEEAGLKLESRKAPFDVIVVDRGNKFPTDS